MLLAWKIIKSVNDNDYVTSLDDIDDPFVFYCLCDWTVSLVFVCLFDSGNNLIASTRVNRSIPEYSFYK